MAPREDVVRVLHLLEDRGLSLAIAESCTGGLLASELAKMPGASKTFLGGVVAYHIRLKKEFLDVPSHILETHGVVSEETATAMAVGIMAKTGSDMGIGISGVAGPEPLENELPGTVAVAIVLEEETIARTFKINGSREEIIEGAVQQTLSLCLDILEGQSI